MTTMPDWLEPMAATLTQERFGGPDWLFEAMRDLTSLGSVVVLTLVVLSVVGYLLIAKKRRAAAFVLDYLFRQSPRSFLLFALSDGTLALLTLAALLTSPATDD